MIWPFVIMGAAGMALVWLLGRLAWLGLQGWAHRRLYAREAALAQRICGKIVRHAPTGRVGFCVGIGRAQHRRLGCLRSKMIVQLVFCPACMAQVSRTGMAGLMVAMQGGHAQVVHAADVVAALSDEARAFRAAMESEAHE